MELDTSTHTEMSFQLMTKALRSLHVTLCAERGLQKFCLFLGGLTSAATG